MDLPNSEESLQKKEELRVLADKAMVKIKKLLERHDLELDDDAERVVRAITEDGLSVGNLPNVLNKDWAIRVALKRMYDLDLRSSTRQRCFEFACELLGLLPQGRASSNLIADVTVNAIKSTFDEVPSV